MADERTVDRIVDLETTTSPLATDYVPVDSTNQGTRRLSFPNLADKTLDELNTKDFNIPTVGERTIPAHIRVMNDRISNIIAPSGQASLAEVVDIRTNFLGETFGTAGDAVRVSDLMLSGFLDLPFIDTSSDANYGIGVVDINKYKGCKIVFTINIPTSSMFPLDSNINMVIRPTDPMDDTTEIALRNPDYSGTGSPYTDYIDDYAEKITQTYTGGYRILGSFTVPSSASYRYIGFVFSKSIANSVKPDLMCYVNNGNRLTFSDPSQDGNIVIS